MMFDNHTEQQMADARRIVLGAGRLAVITGAGMSADSGIATFRGMGSTGGWNAEALRLATPEGFRADPQRVWSRYLLRRRAAREAEPHAGYHALAAWERRARVTVITQNVDGLHTRAGSSEVIELHGTLFRFFCAEQRHPVCGVDDEEEVPRCPVCGSYVRPAVVWFGEWIPSEARDAAAVAVYEAEALVLIGTSLEVSTPKHLLQLAARRHIPIIEVNPEPALSTKGAAGTEAAAGLPAATVALAGSAAAILPRLFALEGADPAP
jgi:NAD-dependent deacetylase